MLNKHPDRFMEIYYKLFFLISIVLFNVSAAIITYNLYNEADFIAGTDDLIWFAAVILIINFIFYYIREDIRILKDKYKFLKLNIKIIEALILIRTDRNLSTLEFLLNLIWVELLQNIEYEEYRCECDTYEEFLDQIPLLLIDKLQTNLSIKKIFDECLEKMSIEEAEIIIDKTSSEYHALALEISKETV